MNTRLVNAAAGVICAAQKVDRTPAGIALALASVQLLQSPETADELAALRAEAKRLRGELDSAVGDCVRLSEERDEAREAVAGLSRDLRDAQHWEGVADRLRAEVEKLRAQVADPTQQGTGAEYAVRANGQVMSILRPCGDTQDGEELVRQDTARRAERYRDTWPDAVMVRRAVRYGPWAEVAGAGESS